ncbi:MAG: hypothetical protein HYZ53_21075 [Planctomycetes bacterium]|nr:hypothetical protein [Planctomycetota bacterium]
MRNAPAATGNDPLAEAPPLEFRSRLAADPAAVWRAATSLDGINDELRPLLRMTAPPGISDLASVLGATGAAPGPAGAPLFAGTLLLGGFLPVDRMRVRPVVLEERRFVERSTLLFARHWEHERRVEPLPGGCEIVDRVRVLPRVPGFGPLARGCVRLLFQHRHRRLARRYAGPPPATAPAPATAPPHREALLLGLLLAAWVAVLSACYAQRCALLLSGDLGNDLAGYHRVLLGEIPYRDFLWGYGPAMPFFYAGVMKLFGVHMAAVQGGYFALLSLASLALYRLALRVVTPVPAVFAALTLFFVAFANHAYNHVACTLAGTLAVDGFLAWHSSARPGRVPWRTVLALALGATVKLNSAASIGAALALAEVAAALCGDAAVAEPGSPAVRVRFARAVAGPLRWGGATIGLVLLFYAPFLVALEGSRLAHAFPYASALHPLEPREFLASLVRVFLVLLQCLWTADLDTFAGWFGRPFLMQLSFLLVLVWTMWQAAAFALRRTRAPEVSFPRLVLGFVAIVASNEFLLTGLAYNLFYYSSPAILLLATLGIGATVRRLVPTFGLGADPAGGDRPALAVAAGVMGTLLVLSSCALELGRHVQFADHPRLRLYVEPDGNSDVVLRVTRFVEAVTAPDEPLVVVPYAPIYFFLTGRRSPLWTDMWQRHNRITGDEELDLVARMEASGVRCVLLTNLAIDRNPWSGSFGTTHAVILSPYLTDRFEPLATLGDGLGWLPPTDWLHGQRVLVLWRKGAQRPEQVPR